MCSLGEEILISETNTKLNYAGYGFEQVQEMEVLEIFFRLEHQSKRQSKLIWMMTWA